jgi:hypothetical protein
MTYSRYPDYGPDDDLPTSKAFDGMRDIRRRNRMKQAAKDAAASAPRNLTARDVADYEKATEQQELHRLARDIRNDAHRVRQIENLMNRDWEAYSNSPWAAELSRLNGAADESKERSR